MLFVDRAEVLSSAFEGASAIACVLPAPTGDVPLHTIRLISHDGAELEPLALDSLTVDGLKVGLAARFAGDLSAAKLQVPSKAEAGKFSSLPALGGMGGEAGALLERVQELVAKVSIFMRPPVVKSVEQLQLQLPAGLEEEAEAGPQTEGGEDAAAAAVAERVFQEKSAAGLLKTIETSKSGKDADRGVIKMLCEDGLSFSSKLPPGESPYGWYAASSARSRIRWARHPTTASSGNQRCSSRAAPSCSCWSRAAHGST